MLGRSPWVGYQPAFTRATPCRRRKVFAGETYVQASERWQREAAIERDRDRDPRLGPGGRILPVLYDD